MIEEELEKLIIEDSLQLEKLEAAISQPNYFEILGIAHKELQHSNFLAWMFDPNESHNGGDYFLKSFINRLPLTPKEKINYNLANLEDTKIFREYHYIDLLIVNERVGFVICIENKIYAPKSGENQLINYFDEVENIWTNLNKIFVYLTPTPRALTEEESNKNYINTTYQDILEILEDTKISVDLAESYIPFIEDYIKNLRKNIMADSKEIELAQKIYRKHKKAIDFIVNNKPSFYSQDLIKAIDNYFANHPEYERLTGPDKNIIRFLPKSVLPFFEVESKTWGDSTSIFALEIFCEDERIWLKFCFARIREDLDEEIREKIQEKKTTLFNKIKKTIKEKYKVKSRPESYYPSVANIDIVRIEDEIVKETEDKFEVFKKSFEKIENSVLNAWVKEVEEKMHDIN
ncbi:PDDEXK-like family protein [Thermophagus sp. OGC60D27]|uniref:PDDEXK-like family protein n=1 Tax=Thermophagus sp. OGC60D27 TaxID=3458415 RepID=UPI004037E373